MAKETMMRTLMSLIVAGFVILSWGIAFGYMKNDVTHISEQADSNTIEIKSAISKIVDVDKMMTRIDTRQEVLIESISSLNDKLEK